MTRRYLVSGLVQGVGFRWFVTREAKARGLRGYVRNRSDGRVEVVACGSPADLADLEQVLRIGPRYAKIVQVDVADVPDETELRAGFFIEG